MSSSRQFARRVALGALALALVPIVVLADAAEALARGWEIVSRLDMLVLAASGLALLGILALVAIGPMRRWLGSRALHLTLLVTTGLLTWLVGELVVGAMFRGADFHLSVPGLVRITRPEPGVMPGITGEAQFTVNSRGIRGPEFPDRDAAYRILAIGGSTTECGYLDDTEAWPQLVMDQLNTVAPAGATRVWVGAIGQSGWDTEQHLRFVQESPLMRRIDCLVALIGINDLQWFVQGGHDPEPVPGPRWSRTPILTRVRARWHRNPEIMRDDAAGAGYRARRQRRQAMTVIDALPDDLAQGLEAYRGRLRAMAEGCRQQGVRLVFVTQPVLWDADMSPDADALLWLGWRNERECLSPRALRAGIDQYNEALRGTSAAAGVSWVDLSMLHANEALFFDDCHFNVAGARAVAGLISAWFLDHRAEFPWGRRTGGASGDFR